MIAFFDFETTGVADFNKRASDPSQPHIVQMAAILTEDDGHEVEMHKCIVKPDGWVIPDEAAAVHGIGTGLAERVGIPEKLCIEIWWCMANRAALQVAHNHQFDKFIARIAARRFGLLKDEQDVWWKALPAFCTMREMTNVVGIPGNHGKCKWPKLSEAYEFCFGKQLTGAHDALTDVRACKEIYFWHKNNVVKGSV